MRLVTQWMAALCTAAAVLVALPTVDPGGDSPERPGPAMVAYANTTWG